ncbi:MAG: CPBP family intramembrane metalloprotease [Chloroflexi bacterium]|nr:CPBP family intramembrane metalloprotease [Chloroflexota bacterium]
MTYAVPSGRAVCQSRIAEASVAGPDGNGSRLCLNGFMEELHFRGLLLKPFERLLGTHAANLCIALFFTLAHAPVRYAPDIGAFMAILLVLSLAWGYVIQETESLWGSVLFHAGADLLIIVGIFEAYGVR